jgi:hypothetical protein
MTDRTPEEKSKFLSTAMSRFKLASEAEAEWRREGLEDLQFCIGSQQWAPEIKSRRANEQRPCLTINRTKQFKKLIVNDQRQQRPAIQINPKGSGASIDDAQILQGIIRSIEVDSESEIADDMAFEWMVITGRGLSRVLTEYADDDSFNQVCKIETIRNPFLWYLDPAALRPDKSDMKWAFGIADMMRDAFSADYPESAAASLDDFSSIGDNAQEWLNKETVRVAEYYYVEFDKVTLKVGDRERIVRKPKVKWAKISAVDILEEADIPCKWIPLVVVEGEDFDINGRRHLAGLIRDLRDPQKNYNVWTSSAAEMVLLGPKAPFLIAEGQIAGHESEWAQANTKNFSCLVYKEIGINGTPVPPPQRNSVEPPIQAIMALQQAAANDMQAVAGINDANLGERRPDESGKAVLLRQKQGDLSTFEYSDNQSRAIRHRGRILMEMIPQIMDVAQVAQIINPDGTTDHAIVHSGSPDDAAELQQDPENAEIKKVLDLSKGKYSVTISVGPSYQTKRQEAVASIMALISAAPQVLNIVGDLLVGNMDWNNAPEIAKRLKKMLPAQLQDDGDDATPEQQLAKAQQQLQAMQQVHQQVMGALQQAQQIIQTKQVEQQGKVAIEKLKTDADVLMAKMRALTPILVAEINTKSQDGQVRQQIDADVAMELHGAAHDIAMQRDQQQNAAALAQQAQAAQQQMAQQQQQQPQQIPSE